MARRRTRRRTSWRRRLGALALGLGLTIVGLEVAVGLAYTAFVAFQDKQNVTAAESGELRILCVGESTTAVAGDGTGRLLVTRTAYPAQLEKILKERAPGVPWKVLNGGIMGGTSSTVLQRLESDLDTLQPHIIIAMMGIKDTPSEWTPFGVALPSWLHRLHVVRLGIWLLEDVSLEATPRPVDIGTVADLPTWARHRFERAGNHIQEPRTTGDRAALDELKVGVYLLTLGHVSLAEERVRRIVERDGVGMVLFAKVLAADGRHEEALAMLQAAIEAHPEEGFYAIAMADLLRRQRRTEAALEALDALDNKGPDDIERFYAELVRAEVFLDRGAPDSALTSLTAPVPTLPRHLREVLPSPELLSTTMLGRVHLARQDWEAAEAFFLDALRLEPDRQANMFMLSQVYRATDRLDAEAELRRRFVARSGRVAEYFELAKLLRLTGDADGAAAVLADAVEQTPSLRENYALLYEMSRRTGARLVVMQYPGFSLASMDAYAPDVDGVSRIDNQTVFDADPEAFFFQPTYPQSFSHYTKQGAEVLAAHVSEAILELPMVADRVP